MTNFESLSVNLKRDVHSVCVDFQNAIQADRTVPIEDFLARVSLEARAALLCELIAVEIELRRAASMPVAREDYYRRFPQHVDTVDVGFAIVENRGRGGAAPPSAAYLLTATAHDTADEAPPPSRPSASSAAPDRLGRFQIERRLGSGAFGAVYLARDCDLDRHVALKVPHAERFTTPAELQTFIEEARTAAKLAHPGIVTIHDVARDGTQVFIVQEYVDGQDLDRFLQTRAAPLSGDTAARLMMAIAEALAFAHSQGFVHRDLKPANILLDAQLRPRVADFGLAVHETAQRRLKGERSGTPAYMSPEQVRGETHRLDGRSDIWSLGVILYEMLSGRRPFGGASHCELFDEIQYRDPKPPRQIVGSIPVELERICLKCLAQRTVDRYSSAFDLVDDLRNWLETPETAGGKTESSERQASRQEELAPPRLVPKGLRSFDAEDAGFFLDLLPGPRDRIGLPESIRFWKTRIEETDIDRTFTIGLLYGPSGCGKSSLVKAGLLPRLAPHVLPIYVEATASETELRLLKGLRKIYPEIPANTPLPELFAALRKGIWLPRGKKVVIVLDQFEQWLHTRLLEPDEPLIQALRQCDGVRLQAVVMVRDDFAMGAARFMDALDVPIVQGTNFATVDLFSLDHARNILTRFGQAYGRIPNSPAEPSGPHQQFLENVVKGLAQESKVISVRLALFAEMIKDKPWTPETLVEVGGTEGIGVTFLEETFSSRSANPKVRQHQQAARAVLTSLLPESGTDIKGHMRSYDELLVASGYHARPHDFEALLRILDKEVRLLTPTDPEGQDTSDDASTCLTGAKYYQLSHDYLVRPLREWLTRKQRETVRGRAELVLAERTGQWHAQPEPRFLPSWTEFTRIVLWTSRRNWNVQQQMLMRAAARSLARRMALLALIVGALAAAIWMVRNEQVAERERLLSANAEAQEQSAARGLVQALVNADVTQVPGIVEQLAVHWRRAAPLVTAELARATPGSPAKLNLSLAVQSQDGGQFEYLLDQLLLADPPRFAIVRDALLPQRESIRERLWEVLEHADNKPAPRKLRAGAALASFDPESPHWSGAAAAVARELVAVNPVHVADWQVALRPAAPHLVPVLAPMCHEDALGEYARNLATLLFADYAADNPELLTSVLLDADPKTFAILFPVVARHERAATTICREILAERLAPNWNDPPLQPSWHSLDEQTVRMIENYQGVVAERFAFCQALPWEQWQAICDVLGPSGYRPLRVRPWRRVSTSESADGTTNNTASSIHVAAIWVRDGRRWELQWDLAHSELPPPADDALRQGLVPLDLAYLPPESAESEPRFALLWGESARSEKCRVRAELTSDELGRTRIELGAQNFVAQRALGFWRNPAGERRYGGIWSNSGAPSEFALWMRGNEYVDQVQTDIVAAPATSSDKADERFCYLLAADTTVESKLLARHGSAEVASQQVHEQSRELLAAGYRPVSIAIYEESNESPSAPASRSVAIVWQRLLIPDQVRQQHAERQASAATILMRFESMQEQTETAPEAAGSQHAMVDALFQHSVDPRTRSRLVHRLAPYRVAPSSIIERLARETEVSRQRAMILGIGEFAHGDQLTTEQRAALTADLARRYRNATDPGVHGASEWALRELGAYQEIARVHDDLATGTPESSREWYFTKTRPKPLAGAVESLESGRATAPLTMVIVRPQEFLMGSPVAEADRFGGPTGRHEARHRRNIGRVYAIGAHEVTVAQFRVFRGEHGFDRTMAREDDAPANLVTWYDAAAFCNWLSEQEGMPRDQWCYDPTQSFSEGMGLYPDYLQRTGYRLPTEAEWEYACRSGTVTARFYGETPALLEYYAWYTKNSQDRWMIPVGSLKPNDLGMFDIFGNAFEWCQDEVSTTTLIPDVLVDSEQLAESSKLAAARPRAVRSGSMFNGAMRLRAAYRFLVPPDSSMHDLGFRVARTLKAQIDE